MNGGGGVSLSDTIETDIDKVESADKNVVIYLPDPSGGERSHNREIVSKCRSVWGNFDFYFTIGDLKSMFIGMLSFFLFWGTLLFHIWPPSLYMTEDMMFWRSSAPSPPPSPQTQSAMAEDQQHHTAVLEIDLDN